MADGEDQDSKTEDATEKRIQDAVEKGNVPLARELVTLGSLLAILLCCTMLAGDVAGNAVVLLGALLESVGQMRLDHREDAVTFLLGVSVRSGMIVLPVILVITAGGVIAALIQNVPQAAAERIRPQFSRISPAAGWKRVFGIKSLVEFGKSLVKLAGVLSVTLFVLRAQVNGIFNTLHSGPGAIAPAMLDMTVSVIAALCVISLFLALFDVAWSRFSWRKGLRMSHQDLKDEFKQSEGNPQLKAKARNAARQRSSRNMFAKLPTATMVITNPTHFAVALRYLRDEGGAPVVVAKGVDHLALRIREAASKHDIPMIENRPLARSLYDSVEVDQEIPPELYRAVAEVIHYIHLRQSYRSSALARPEQA